MVENKKWFIVSFNPAFSRKTSAFLEKNKLQPIALRDQTQLIHTQAKMWKKTDIQPYLISATEMKKHKNENEIKNFIQKNSKKDSTYALRAWILDKTQTTGRDMEVKLGMALEKKGVKMNPALQQNIWFVLKHQKDYFVATQPLPLGAHPFPMIDSRFTEDQPLTRSGHKLRFLLHAFQFDVTTQVGADLGCGTGGWTQLLLEKGATKVYAIDKTKLDKTLQKNKKVAYIPKKTEETPKLPQKLDFIVADINVGPEHAKKIFLNFDKKNPGAKHAIITQKIMQGKDLEKLPAHNAKWAKWIVKGIRNSWFARRECYLYLIKKQKLKRS